MEIINGIKINFGKQVSFDETFKIDNKSCRGNKLKIKQLSFLEPLEPMEKEKYIEYDATICF